MTTDMDTSKTNEYYVTALQIFDYCRTEGSGTLRVDTLMDKFAPFVKTNKDEFGFLKSLLDPEQENPEISVTKLAKALHKYSETHKSKVDLDESFNLRCGHAPQDSDSGISTDGYQLLEDLQSELREKSHAVSQLRSQLEFTDRQHEEALAALVAERDTLRVHLNMLREENSSLTHLRQDYEEACERLCASDGELEAARRELDAVRRRDKLRADEIAQLQAQKQALQDLLSKSKEECHRVNEMYASRQSALLEENESIKSAHADLAARLQDQEEFLQQIIKEKVLLEMELKDLLNKSNQTALRFDRSIDVSYTEDQMLSALDSLNSDTRFSQDVTSVSTQVEVPCVDCTKRTNAAPSRGLRWYFWEGLKCLFQVFAVVCFLCAISALYGVPRRSAGARCRPVPWRWLHAQELLDLLLRIDYVAEVPM